MCTAYASFVCGCLQESFGRQLDSVVASFTELYNQLMSVSLLLLLFSLSLSFSACFFTLLLVRSQTSFTAMWEGECAVEDQHRYLFVHALAWAGYRADFGRCVEQTLPAVQEGACWTFLFFSCLLAAFSWCHFFRVVHAWLPSPGHGEPQRPGH